MQKKLYIGTNTKMYKGIADTVSYLAELEQLTSDISREDMQLFVIPSYTALYCASQRTKPEMISLGAQNMCWEKEGQFTGEISPLMLKEVGVEIVELGHSERRHVLMETDEMIRKKVHCALENDFTTLLCVGETRPQKELGLAEYRLRKQLETALSDIPQEWADRLWVAYEPVWAIGVGGTPASAEYAEQMHIVIRNCLCELFGANNGAKIPILYGGSVNPDNAVNLIKMEHIDGLFIGRSAWDAPRFDGIIRSVLPVWRERATQL